MCMNWGKFLKKWWVMQGWGESCKGGVGYVGLGGLCRGGVGYVEVEWVLHFFPIYIQPFMYDSKLEKY